MSKLLENLEINQTEIDQEVFQQPTNTNTVNIFLNHQTLRIVYADTIPVLEQMHDHVPCVASTTNNKI